MREAEFVTKATALFMEMQAIAQSAENERDQLRAQLAAVEDYADYAHRKWCNNTPAFSFADWYAANHTQEVEP